jgi:hypothetical protein
VTCRTTRDERGIALVKLLLLVAVGVPGGYYAYGLVRDSVGDQTLRTDVRNAVDLEAACNSDRSGAGYAAGSTRSGGRLVLDCGSTVETMRASAGNRLIVTVTPNGLGFQVVGLRPGTGMVLRYDSATGAWS